MPKKRTLIFTCMLFSAALCASNEQGTGRSTRVMVDSSEHWVVIESDQGNGTLVGSTQTEDEYGEIILDQLQNNGQLNSSWGKAEVMLSCYQADVLLYQRVADSWVELEALQVETSYCPAP